MAKNESKDREMAPKEEGIGGPIQTDGAEAAPKPAADQEQGGDAAPDTRRVSGRAPMPVSGIPENTQKL